MSQYIFGMLPNGQSVIGERSVAGYATDDEKLEAPMFVDVQIIQDASPLTGRPVAGKAKMSINCIPLPVSFIYTKAIQTVLSHPVEGDMVLAAYHHTLSMQKAGKLSN